MLPALAAPHKETPQATVLGQQAMALPRPSKSPARSITSAQSPIRRCRKIRSVGYHGLSSRPLNQRQQLSYRSSSTTLRPSAPTTDVSTLTTMSRFAMIAAVSAKSRTRGIGSDMKSGAGCPSCRLTSDTPGPINIRNHAGSTLRRAFSTSNPGAHGRACPVHTQPIRRSAGNRALHASTSLGSARKYGTRDGILAIVIPNARGRLNTGQ